METHEQLVLGDARPGGGSMLSPGSSELPIDGPAIPIDGTLTTSLEGGPGTSLAGSDTMLRLAKDSPQAPDPVEPPLSRPANSNRPVPQTLNGDGRPDDNRQGNGRAARRARFDPSDPEKVRLVAEINAVWKRLEAVEDKRLRLREEVDELRLSLSEEQRARSTATRELRQAEEREAKALDDIQDLKRTCARLERELESARQSLLVQRWEFLAKGAAAASGVLGVAAILTRALIGRAPSALLKLPAMLG